jgi:hypothetical protein
VSLTLTATPDPSSGTVALQLTSPADVLTLTRSDVNGTRPVRVPAGTIPGSGTLTITDYEPALTGQIQYRATTATDPEASAWVTLGGGLPRFVMPSIPLYSVEVDTVYAYSAPRATRGTVHEVVGRADPIIVAGRMGTRRGTLGIVCDDHGDVLRLTSMMERGQTVLYRQSDNPGMDMYFYPLGVAPAPSSGKWELSVDYVELAYPSGPVQSDPSWTFGKLARTATTFAKVSTDYADFNALTLNEKKP